jgi:hypothetical protein
MTYGYPQHSPLAETPHDRFEARIRWNCENYRRHEYKFTVDKLADFMEEVSSRKFPMPGENLDETHVLADWAVTAVDKKLFKKGRPVSRFCRGDISKLVEVARVRKEALVFRVFKSQIHVVQFD